MPVLRDTASRLCHQFDDLHFVIPIAGTIDPAKVRAYFTSTALPYTLINGKAIETAACSDCVVVASGTASLECALQIKPMCIIYKASWLTYLAAFKLIKVNYLGLCNLLENEMIVPELLQYDCNATELSCIVVDLLDNDVVKHRMESRLKRLKQSLSSVESDCSIVALIEKEMSL